MDADENQAEHVENDSVVDGRRTALVRRECEEFLGGPDLVNPVDVLDFFLLNGLLVELRGDFVAVDVAEQLEVVQQSK